jgi:hypothetical protein
VAGDFPLPIFGVDGVNRIALFVAVDPHPTLG